MAGTVNEPTEEHAKVYEDNLRFASKLLENEGIVGLIEPINCYSVPKYYLNSYEKGLEVLRKIKSPNLKLMLDIFHLQFIKGNLTRNISELLPDVG
ncbi:unnamed protein product, partial [Timema podura]|nr:unnamed protein product [Timema podura]